eukprot:1159894-Pelagomonas_calceolata.AAC.3
MDRPQVDLSREENRFKMNVRGCKVPGLCTYARIRQANPMNWQDSSENFLEKQTCMKGQDEKGRMEKFWKNVETCMTGQDGKAANMGMQRYQCFWSAVPSGSASMSYVYMKAI